MRRHYWRYVGFNELSELYTSMLLRSTGLSLIGIFVPIYLYKLEYGLPVIFLFMAILFGSRILGNPIAGYLVALKGPKHIMLYSYIIQIISLLLLLTLPNYAWPLWLIAIVWGFATSLFFIAYHVDFSKVMHADHGGKELGFMTIVERLGGALGPLAGGVIATLFGAQYTIAAAVALFILAVIPLFMTAEPTLTHQKLHFRGLPYRKLRRDFFSFAMVGVDNISSLAVWPLFLAVTILTTNTYASVGLVTSVGVVAAILSARFIGQLIDHRHGGRLLKWAASIGAILHMMRPLVGSIGGVLLMNVAHDAVATGHRLAYIKGMYGRVEELPGLRIVYVVVMETASDVGKATLWLSVWGTALFLGAERAMEAGFVLAAVASLLIMTQRFPALKRSLV